MMIYRHSIAASSQIIALTCPHCHNRTVYDVETEARRLLDIDYWDLCVCDECGSEFRADPQFNGTIKLLEAE